MPYLKNPRSTQDYQPGDELLAEQLDEEQPLWVLPPLRQVPAGFSQIHPAAVFQI